MHPPGAHDPPADHARGQPAAARGFEHLKATLRRALGQQIGQVGAADFGARVDELTVANKRFEDALAQEWVRNELQGRLIATEDDLAATRTSLRRVIRSEDQQPASCGTCRPPLTPCDGRAAPTGTGAT